MDHLERPTPISFERPISISFIAIRHSSTAVLCPVVGPSTILSPDRAATRSSASEPSRHQVTRSGPTRAEDEPRLPGRRRVESRQGTASRWRVTATGKKQDRGDRF
jgi:hypothetical protein